MSGQYTGNIQTFDSKCCSSSLVKEEDLLEAVTSSRKNVREKFKLHFFGKSDFSCLSFFPQITRNMEGKKCISIQNCGVTKFVPIENVNKKCGVFTVILNSEKILKRKRKSLRGK